MTDATQETPEVSNPQINIVDLRNAVKIIDIAAERGAFKGQELSSVGSVRDKLAAFVAAVTPVEGAPEAPEAEGDAEAA